MWLVVDSDGNAVLTPRGASWAGLMGHTVKGHHAQHAQVLPTPADMWLLQRLRASLHDSVCTHEAGSMLLQKLEKELKHSSVVSGTSAQNQDCPARCLTCPYQQHDDMLAEKEKKRLRLSASI